MIWILKVNDTNSRVQWVEKEFKDRDYLQQYLDYFHINNYKGPGQYETADGNCYEIRIKE